MTENYLSLYKKIVVLVFLLQLLTGCKPAVLGAGDSKSQNEAHYTSGVLKKIERTGILRVGTTGDFMPFSYRTDPTSDSISGIDIVLAKDLARVLGVRLQLIKTSWPTLMADLKSGKFDIGMSGITITQERQQEAYFSKPVYSSGKVAITRDEHSALYTSIDAINSKGVRVIVNPGGTNEKFAMANFPKATLIQNDDNISIFQKLIDGTADVMVTDGIEALVQERLHPELEAVNGDTPFNTFDFGYLLPKDQQFKNHIDIWLLRKVNEPRFQKLLATELKKIEKGATATKR